LIKSSCRIEQPKDEEGEEEEEEEEEERTRPALLFVPFLQRRSP